MSSLFIRALFVRALFTLVLISCASSGLTAAWAQDHPSPGLMTLGGIGILPAAFPTISYTGYYVPNGDSVLQNQLSLRVPVYRDEQNALSLSAEGQSLHLSESPVLDTSDATISNALWKTSLGAAYSHKLEGGQFYGGGISVGSASDHPFAQLNVTTIGMSAYYSWPNSDNSRWIVTLFFSNNNPLVNYIPIPGFIYLYETPQLIGLFGVPFSVVMWKPTDPWMFTASFFGPVVTAEAAYGDAQKVQIYTGYNWNQQPYLLEDRPAPDDRLYYAEMHVPLGVRFPIARFIRSDFSVGYAFDRQVYEGAHLLSKEVGNANLQSSWYASWNLKVIL